MDLPESGARGMIDAEAGEGRPLWTAGPCRTSTVVLCTPAVGETYRRAMKCVGDEAMKKETMAKLALLVTAMLWGTSLTVVKTASVTFRPNFILAVRFTLAALLLAVVFWKKLRKITKEDLKAGLGIGVFLFLAYSSQTLGVTCADPGRSGFLSASYCVIVPFLAWAVEHKRPDRFNLAAAVICVAGIFCVAMSNSSGGLFPSTREEIMGDGLALLSGVLFAAHIVVVEKLSGGRDPAVMTILQFTAAAAFSWITTLALEDNSAMVISSPRPVLELVYLAVMCTAVSILFQNIGQKYTDPNSAAIILGMESIFGVIFPVMLGIEHVTGKSLAGFVLIFAAIIISETKLGFLKRGGREDSAA